MSQDPVKAKRPFGFGWLKNTIKKAFTGIGNKTKKVLDPEHNTTETFYKIENSYNPGLLYVIEYIATHRYFTTLSFKTGYKYNKEIIETTYEYDPLNNNIKLNSTIRYTKNPDEYYFLKKECDRSLLSQFNKKRGIDILDAYKDLNQSPVIAYKDLNYGYGLELRKTINNDYHVELKLKGEPIDIMHFYCNNQTVKDAIRLYYQHRSQLNQKINPEITPMDMFTKMKGQAGIFIKEFFKETKTLYTLFFKKHKDPSMNVKPGDIAYENFVTHFDLLPEEASSGYYSIIRDLRETLEKNEIHYYTPVDNLMRMRAYKDLGMDNHRNLKDISKIDANRITNTIKDFENKTKVKNRLNEFTGLKNVDETNKEMKFNNYTRYFSTPPGK